MRRRGGFTLIELLVVIAIIGILAAMLFPVFARARESARKIQCLSNVKNIAMAVQMYLSDYGRFPNAESDPATLDYFEYHNPDLPNCITTNAVHPNPYLRWPVVFDEYIKNRDVWRCPSAKTTKAATWIVAGSNWLRYVMNNEGKWGVNAPGCSGGPCCFAWPPGWGGTVTDSIGQALQAGEGSGAFVQSIATTNNYGLADSAMEDPAEFVVCGDGGAQTDTFMASLLAFPEVCFSDCGGISGCCSATCDDGAACGVATDLKTSGAWWNDPTTRKSSTRHMGGSNLGFADGHAKWWSAESIIAATPRFEATTKPTPELEGVGLAYSFP